MIKNILVKAEGGGVKLKKRMIFVLISMIVLSGIIYRVEKYRSEVDTEENTYKSTDKSIEIEEKNKDNNIIYDHANGFSMVYPQGMDVDTSISEVKTVIKNEDMTIEIYYDDFRGTEASSSVYKNYSNKFLENTKDHVKEYEKNMKINGKNTYVLKWSRDKITNITDDKNYYVSADIEKNENEIYTVFIKSSKPFLNKKEFMNIVKNFKIIEKREVSEIRPMFKKIDRSLNEETREFFEKYFTDSDKLKWGIFEASSPDDMDYLHEIEDRIDYNFEFVVRYQSLSHSPDVPLDALKKAYDENKYVELTLQTIYNDERDNSGVLYDILKGKYDEYLNKYAKDIKLFSHPVLFRLNNEMNGDWCLYSAYHFSKDTDIFNKVWIYIYDIFEENGVDNALWVWNPHDGSFPNFKWNHYLNYYPGDEYVDIIGLTGYNAGTYYPGEIWRGFKEIYDPLYEEYVNLFEQPLMITEFASNSVGGDKIAWINEMFDNMKRYDRIKVAIWWSYVDWDAEGNAARVYRLDETDEIIENFKNGLSKYK